MPVLILGCGFTGRRVAKALTNRGCPVVGTSRNPQALREAGIEAVGLNVTRPESIESLRNFVTQDTRVLISVPSVGVDYLQALTAVVQGASRVVYLSTTGVYGSQHVVDEHTPAAPRTAREQERVDAERAISKIGPHLILRPAAIYGPQRGIHAALREGTFRLWGDGGNYVSRIHVDDLATHCIEGLFSEGTGAWPVADEEACTSLEIAEFCARLLGKPLPARGEPEELGETRRTDRRVDGSAIRRLLGIELKYASYRTGIPACIAAEAVDRNF